MLRCGSSRYHTHFTDDITPCSGKPPLAKEHYPAPLVCYITLPAWWRIRFLTSVIRAQKRPIPSRTLTQQQNEQKSAWTALGALDVGETVPRLEPPTFPHCRRAASSLPARFPGIVKKNVARGTFLRYTVFIYYQVAQRELPRAAHALRSACRAHAHGIYQRPKNGILVL